LKIGLKYKYLNDIDFFPFPISKHDAIKHIKKSQKKLCVNKNFKGLKRLLK
jgi:hypothetical protein